MTGLPPELLSAVLDAPDDDAPRLACADWLEEHGRPEDAHFVRLQVREAARARLALPSAEIALLRLELRRLESEHAHRWRVPVAEAGLTPTACNWSRGFLSFLRAYADQIDHRQLAALASAFPTLERLELSGRSTVRVPDDLKFVLPLRLLRALTLPLAPGRALRAEHLAPLVSLYRLSEIRVRGAQTALILPAHARWLQSERLRRAAVLPTGERERVASDLLGDDLTRLPGVGTAVRLTGDVPAGLTLATALGDVFAVSAECETVPAEWAGVPDVRSVRLSGLTGRPDPSPLSGLRHVQSVALRHGDMATGADRALGAWAGSLPELRTLEVESNAGFSDVLDGLGAPPGLRVLHLSGLAQADPPTPDAPRLIEVVTDAPLDLGRFPALRHARLVGPECERLGGRLAERGVCVDVLDGQMVERWYQEQFEMLTRSESLDGVALRVPEWLGRVPPPTPESPDAVPLAAWCEWGDGDPRDRFDPLGPAWLVVERLDFPVLPRDADRHLAGPRSPADPSPRWPPVRAEGPRREVFSPGGACGHFRAVWPGARFALRLRAEWGRGRATPWRLLSQLVADSLASVGA